MLSSLEIVAKFLNLDEMHEQGGIMYEDNYENILKKNDEAQEEAEELQEVQERCLFLGGKIKGIFWCELIAGIAYAILKVILENVSIYGVFRYPLWQTASIPIILAATMIICYVLNCIFMILMAKYYESFLYAGVLLVIANALAIVEEFIADQGVSMILTLVAAVLSIMQMYYFIHGMTSALSGIDFDLQSKWEMYWKGFWILFGAFIVCTLFIIIPVIRVMASLLLLVFPFVMFAFEIWRYVLLWKSPGSLIGYALYYESRV